MSDDPEIDVDFKNAVQEHLTNIILGKQFSASPDDLVSQLDYLEKELKAIWDLFQQLIWTDVREDCDAALYRYYRESIILNAGRYPHLSCMFRGVRVTYGADPEVGHILDLRFVPYAVYLKSKHWQSVRAMARRFSAGKCMLCGAIDVELHTHHNTYENRGFERPEDVIRLCRECHAKHHEK